MSVAHFSNSVVAQFPSAHFARRKFEPSVRQPPNRKRFALSRSLKNNVGGADASAKSTVMDNGEVTKANPVPRSTESDAPQFPVSLAWKALLGTTGVVMAVGSAAAGVAHVQSENQSQWNHIVHLAENRSPTASLTPSAVVQNQEPLLLQAREPPPLAQQHSTNLQQVTLAPGKGSIDTPSDGSVVHDDFVRVTGHVEPSVSGDLWVVLYPERAPGRGWVQSSDVSRGAPAVRVGDRFRVGAFLGGPPQSYDVVLYSASPEASHVFAGYLQEAAAKDRHVGLSTVDMPKGLVELSRVTITSSRAHH
jgi:hypothetical protein